MVIDEAMGTTEYYGQQTSEEAKSGCRGSGVVTLRIRKETFWVRLALFADMGFAESYMLGEMDCDDLTSFFQVRLDKLSPFRARPLLDV